MLLTGFGRARRLTERSARRLPGSPEVLELDVNCRRGHRRALGRAAQALGPRRRRRARDRLRPAGRARRRLPRDPPESAGGRLPDQRLLAEGAGAGRAASDGERRGQRRGRALRRHRRPRFRRQRRLAGLRLDGRRQSRAGVGLPLSRPRPRARAGSASTWSRPGPVRTIAAGGIPGFDDLAELWDRSAPLGWDTARPRPGGRRRLLSALRLLAGDQRRDPARRRRAARDGRGGPATSRRASPCRPRCRPRAGVELEGAAHRALDQLARPPPSRRLGPSNSSSSWIWRTRRVSSSDSASASCGSHHRDLDDVRRRALDRHVDREPLALAADLGRPERSSGIGRRRPSRVVT